MIPAKPFSEFTLISGDYSIGKTAFLTSILLNLLSHDIPVVFLSLYTNAEAFVKRFKKSLIKYLQDICTDNHAEREHINDLIEKIDSLILNNKINSSLFTINEIQNFFKEYSSKDVRAYCLIDDLQFLKDINKVGNITEVFYKLKKMARINNIEILATTNLCQSDKIQTPFIPTLKSIYNSDIYFENVDKVILIRRPEFYGFTAEEEKESTYQLAQLYLYNFSEGFYNMSKLKFDSRYGLFSDFSSQNYLIQKSKWEIEDDPF